MDSLILKALKIQKTHRPPIWLMRQAGRYMPEYRRIKERYSFLELCKQPDLATQVTLLPVQQFQPDAAILFADILLLLETLGFKLGFGNDHGPLVDSMGRLENLSSLPRQNVEESFTFMTQTIKQLKEVLSIPLLGFCGAPFTLATYVLEGKTTKDFQETRKWMHNHPEKLHHLLDILTEQTLDYLNLQRKAKVDALQIFDSWAGYFSYVDWKTFSYPYLKKIIQSLKPSGLPIILFAKGSCALVDDLVELAPTAISFDSAGDLLKLAKRVPSSIAIQGNLDPTFLQAPLDQIEKEVKRLAYGLKDRPGYIFNLGHGLLPNSPLNAVECLFKTVQNLDFSRDPLAMTS